MSGIIIHNSVDISKISPREDALAPTPSHTLLCTFFPRPCGRDLVSAFRRLHLHPQCLEQTRSIENFKVGPKFFSAEFSLTPLALCHKRLTPYHSKGKGCNKPKRTRQQVQRQAASFVFCKLTGQAVAPHCLDQTQTHLKHFSSKNAHQDNGSRLENAKGASHTQPFSLNPEIPASLKSRVSRRGILSVGQKACLHCSSWQLLLEIRVEPSCSQILV